MVNGSSMLSRVFSCEVKSGTFKQNMYLFTINTINFVMLCRCAAACFKYEGEGAKLFILKCICNTRD